ncbi:hypothetical protein Esti_001809 [Eimeria stiedai]
MGVEEEETLGEQQLLQEPPTSARLLPLQQQQQQAGEAAAGASDLRSGELHASSLEEKVDEFLDKLCNAGALTLGKALLLKQHFFKLHERFVHASLKESRAAARLQRLAEQLRLQQQDLGEAATRTAQHAEQISNLKGELNQKKAEAVRSASRQLLLQQQKQAFKHEARELEAQLNAQLHRCTHASDTETETEAETETETKTDRERDREGDNSQSQREAYRQRAERGVLALALKDTLMQHEGLKGQLAELSSQPQRQAEQRELAEHMLHAVEQQGVRTAHQAEEQDALCAQSAAQIQALNQQIEQQQQKLKEQRRMSEELEPQHRTMRSRLGVSTPQLEFVEGNEVHSAAQAALKSVAGQLHRAREELLHSRTAFEKSKVDYKRGWAQRDLAATLLPPFVARKGELDLQKKALFKEAATRAKAAEFLKAENEALYGSMKGDTLEAHSAQKRLCELMEAQQRQQVGIERVRRQCESYANQMQVATQGLAELVERQKVLASELHVFSQDIKAKEATTQAIALQCLKALQQRAVLRNQHSRLLQKIAKCNEEVEQSMLTSERLNCCLSEMEETMRTQKDAYERAVESRNLTGVHLVDRNDELCLMWERSNALGKPTLLGKPERGCLGQELSRLKTRVGELKHQLQQQQKRCLELPQLADEVSGLNEQLAKERINTKRLCLELENPNGGRRWRETGRPEPSMEDLKAREKELHKQLRAKQSQLIDLELQLEELDAVNEELQKKVSPDRELGVELLQRLGSLRQRVDDIQRKKRCLSSEALMYKTMLPQLDCMQQRLAEELEMARVNVLQRLPPTEAVATELQQQDERRWKRRQILEDMKEVKRREKEEMLPSPSSAMSPTQSCAPRLCASEAAPPYDRLSTCPPRARKKSASHALTEHTNLSCQGLPHPTSNTTSHEQPNEAANNKHCCCCGCARHRQLQQKQLPLVLQDLITTLFQACDAVIV